MAYVIYLICCAAHGALMTHLKVSLKRWEYWASLAILLVIWTCGRLY